MLSRHPVLNKLIVDKQLATLTPIENINNISLASWVLHDKLHVMKGFSVSSVYHEL